MESPFQRWEDSQWTSQPRLLLVGQMKEPVTIRPAGLVSLIGIRFHPWGARPFMATPSFEFSGQIIPLDQASVTLQRALETQVNGYASVETAITQIQKVLIQHLRNSDDLDLRVELAVRLAMQRRGLISISALAETTNISTRQFERKFLEEVGITPRTLCRILRFQHVFRTMSHASDTKWAGIAFDSGYYDQAHLIRDFQQFAGETPARLPVLEDSLTSKFSRANRMSHFYNTFD